MPPAASRPLASPHYLPALTGIRVIAAYLVCFSHYNPFLRFEKTGGWGQAAFGIFNELHTGVTIFFVLSGFLICYRYYASVPRLTGGWFKRYFLNRVARIYPMYLLVTLATFALIEWDPGRYELVSGYSALPAGERTAIFALNVTLLKGFFDDFKFTGLAQGWSLTVEECFYLCAPFFLLSIRRSRWAWVALPALTLAAMLGLWLTVGQLNFYGLFGNLPFLLNFTFFGRCLEFFAGMGLAVYLMHRRRNQASAPARSGGWLTAISVVLFVVCLVAMAAVNPDGPPDAMLGRLADARFRSAFSVTFINNLLLPGVIVLLFYGLLTESTWLRHLLSTKVFDVLGKSSYIFYLVHTGVFNVWLRTYVAHHPVAQFIFLNGLSVALHYWVEAPLHRWLKPR